MQAHGGYVKAAQIARIAKEHGWHGCIDYEKSTHETTLFAYRNGQEFDTADEKLSLVWKRNRLIDLPEYTLLNRTITLPSQHVVIEIITGYPDLVKILKKHKNRKDIATLVKRYRRLPFNLKSDNNETIMNRLVGRRLWWYNRISGTISTDVVEMPKTKKHNEIFCIKQVGKVRLFNFVTRDVGMRSVILETILKVE